MPKTLTSEQLRQWYKNFAKELYERAQIDITQKEDLGRVKNFYITEWDPDEPMHPQGDFQYAYIPHKQLQYDNPPPPITEAQCLFQLDDGSVGACHHGRADRKAHGDVQGRYPDGLWPRRR